MKTGIMHSYEQQIEIKNKRPITPEINEWSDDLDTTLPIDGRDIPHFSKWVNGNGFRLDRETRKGHNGFDFGAYLTDDGTIVVGLDKDTPVRAVADGKVAQVLVGESTGGPYGCMVSVEHGDNDSGMFSQYVHINPSVKYGDLVKKGDILGTLYKDPGEDEGRLVHLHFMISDGWGTHGSSIVGGGSHLRQQDPGIIDNSIYDLTVEQGWRPFKPQVIGAFAVKNANFKRIKIGGDFGDIVLQDKD